MFSSFLTNSMDPDQSALLSDIGLTSDHAPHCLPPFFHSQKMFAKFAADDLSKQHFDFLDIFFCILRSFLRVKMIC